MLIIMEQTLARRKMTEIRTYDYLQLPHLVHKQYIVVCTESI